MYPDCVVRRVATSSVSTMLWVPALPPVDRLLAPLHLFERAGNELRAAAMSPVAAELPELPRRSLVAVDQFVQLEGVQLASVVAIKALPYPLKQLGERAS